MVISTFFASFVQKPILNSDVIWLTLFSMGLFGTTHGWGGGVQKEPSSIKSVTYMLQLWNLAQFEILPIEDSQNIWKNSSRDKNLEFYWHQHFFHRKSANFAISRNTDIDWNLIHNFQFLISFLKKCFQCLKIVLPIWSQLWWCQQNWLL